ncbi:dual specificity protein phosphatase CDC14A isoform X1 [Hydra vulgaris]|uniref:dual specificity protein phosphatase CDC14A isoform X1 n=1 Tax=Hydra vulgaris TaxID=6087 RepID=UPI001F5FBF66|nr:dual specificity protein phosphatase CDC14A-like [Hydra vulgaris]
MELIEGRLFFLLELPNNNEKKKNLTEDTTIYLDKHHKNTTVQKHFGPPSLKSIWEHCREVDLKLKNFKRVFYITNSLKDNFHIEQRTLSSFLMACYAVLQLNWTPEKTNSLLLQEITVKLAFFRDYHGDSSYKLNILDCLQGLYMGCKIQNWFSSYESIKYPQTTNFHLDMNLIVPGKYIAFKDPTINSSKKKVCVSKSVMNELKRCGIKAVVRLNGNDHLTNLEYYGPPYSSSEFKQEQFFHFEIPSEDAGVPSITQINEFEILCKRFAGKVAVHCHAGLGRTATMIGSILIKSYGFDSRAVCGWLKMCRRGSIMGSQHFFLDKFQKQIESKYSFNHQITTTLLKARPLLEVPQQNHPIKAASIGTSCKCKGTNNIIRIEKAQKKNPVPKLKFEATSDLTDVKPIRRCSETHVTSANYKNIIESSKSYSPQTTFSNEIATTNIRKSMSMPTNQLSVSKLNLMRNSIIPKRQPKTPQPLKTVKTLTSTKSILSDKKILKERDDWVTEEVVAPRKSTVYYLRKNAEKK